MKAVESCGAGRRDPRPRKKRGTDRTTLCTILCPIDFSDQSRHALRWAEALASRHQSRLIILTAVDPLLAEAAKVRLGLCSGPCQTIVSLGRPDAAIASIAEEQKAGLIVMGLGGGPGLLVPRPGSIAYRVFSVASAPVLVVPPEPLAP